MTEKLDLIKQGKAYLQTTTIKGHKEQKYTTIDRHTTFFTLPTIIRKRYDDILENCNYIKRYILSENDEKELNTLYHGFAFNELAAFIRSKSNRTLEKFGKGDIVLMPRTKYNKVPYAEMNIFNFFISNNEYKDWLTSPYGIIFHPVLKDIPHPISACEKLFDKNVLPIKKLVKDIGDLNNLTIKESKKKFLYDNSNLISNIFFTELNKKIQVYGYISVLYNNCSKLLITSKNRLKLDVLADTEREFLTLLLEDILTPHKIETTDSKIRNISILATNTMNRKIIDQIKIEGFQKFEQYMTINPISIEINDSEIQTKLRFNAKKYKYRFIANSLLFSSSVKENTKTVFITKNGLNDARDILVNGKLF